MELKTESTYKHFNFNVKIFKRQWQQSNKSGSTRVFLLIACTVLLVQFPSSLASYASSDDHRTKTTNEPAPFHCEADIKNCIEPVTSKLCSGKGACVCGTCACFNTEFEKYYGRFCEHCESCSLNFCELLQPCVECKVHETGPFSTNSDCDANCSRFPEIQIAEVTSSDEKVDHFFCTFKDSEDCEFYFIYGYDAAGHLVIIAQREKECPARLKPPNLATSQQQQTQSRNYGRKLSVSAPAIFKELPNVIEINDFDSPIETDQETDQAASRVAASYNNNDLTSDNRYTGSTDRSNAVRVKTRKKALNTEAFDLMIVCGLSMTRSSSGTSQQPQYFQRNGIHFDVKNCQFIPNSEHFIFASDGGLKDITSNANSIGNHHIFTIYSSTSRVILLVCMSLIASHFLLS